MTVPTTDNAPQGADGRTPTALGSRLTILAVASALFMQFIDSTALSTALPRLAQAFHTNPVNLKLALTGYILAQAVFIPASGWAADRFGARRVFMTAMAVFLIGSALCGFSQSLGQLVGFRILQGVGGAMMMPVGRTIVVGAYPKDQLVQAMVWLTTPAMLGPILGPPLAGFILQVADWPWIFFINLPVGILGMIAVLRFVPRRRQPDPGPFDAVGFLLSATAICALMVGAESAGVGLLPGWVQLLAWLIALGAGGAYVAYAARREHPVLNLRLLKISTIWVNLTGGTLFRLAMGATPFLLPLLLQGGLGWTPLQAGSVSLFGAVGALGARFGAQQLIRRLGYRTVLLITSICGGLAGMAPALFNHATPVVLMMALLAVAGFFRANQMTALGTLSFADVPDRLVSQASTVTAVLQQMSLALGITVGGLALHISQALNLAHSASPLDPRNFILPFTVIGGAGVLASLFYLRLPADAGANLRGRPTHRDRS